MKFVESIKRSVGIILALAVALSCGYIYHTLGHKLDLKKHPLDYTEFVEKYSSEYGVPNYIVYAMIHEESDYVSNLVSGERVGLMQLTPETLRWLLTLTKEDLDPGILYDPETNIKYGTYMLSHLYNKYSRWRTVIAIYCSSEDTVARWCEDPENTDDNGNLTVIPDEEVKNHVERIEKEIEIYKKLYFDISKG